MNADQLARLDAVFDAHYPQILADATEREPASAVRRTRAGFASAYRFWSKVEADGDPVAWIQRAIAQDGRSTRRRTGREPGDEPAHRAIVERRRVAALARRQRAVAGVVLGTSALAVIGAELFVVHR